eukprot:SAG25_NODE_528_length_7179_cov_40.901836_5_plen_191_part_00
MTPAHASARPTSTPQLLAHVTYSVILPRRALDMDTVTHRVNASARRGGAARLAPMLQDATTTLVIPVVRAHQMGPATHVHALVAGRALTASGVIALVVHLRHRTAAFARPCVGGVLRVVPETCGLIGSMARPQTHSGKLPARPCARENKIASVTPTGQPPQQTMAIAAPCMAQIWHRMRVVTQHPHPVTR